MKTIKEINTLINKNTSIKEIHAIQDVFVVKYLDVGIPSTEVTCPICGGNNGLTCLMDPPQQCIRLWFCQELNCLTAINRSRPNPTNPTGSLQRSILWPLFCEKNAIGDFHHSVSFESIEQSPEKIESLRKFSEEPTGIILMRGDQGTGKTYAAMGLCELFTRSNSSCVFFTHNHLHSLWLDKALNLRQQLSNCSLLIIDDFGTGDPSPKFSEFFMEIINTRMQWKKRGTVITTNLSFDKLSEFCGDALTGRLNTAKVFNFSGKTRRKPTL